MTTIEKSIVINAPLEKVTAVIDQAERSPEWYAGIDDIEVDPRYPEVGSTNKMTYKAAGIAFEMTGTVLQHERLKRKSKLGGMITGTHVYELTPMGETTRVKLTTDYEMPGGGLGKIVDRLVVERTNDKNIEQSLANLKVLVESE
ncbi:MAG: hypothetical protein GWN04_00440 [Gammaproteobacteria bacterium]|nr:hypothetical protein [Gammaproteobacteria bacterium]NIX16799.1 hypothetical protein [Gammaproteobacteria bacterium]